MQRAVELTSPKDDSVVRRERKRDLSIDSSDTWTLKDTADNRLSCKSQTLQTIYTCFTYKHVTSRIYSKTAEKMLKVTKDRYRLFCFIIFKLENDEAM